MTASGEPVVRVAVPAPLPRLFDYLPPANSPLPPPGSRVIVGFARRRLVGLVIAHGRADPDSDITLRAVESVVDEALIDSHLLELIEWCRRYYGFAPGEAVNLLLPGALRRVRPFRETPPQAFELTAAGRQVDLARAPRQAEVRDLLSDGPLPRGELRAAGIRPEILKRMQALGRVRAVTAEPAAPTLRPGPDLNAEQRHAAAAILAARHRFQTFLLAGVTGSGKTEVYLRSARRLLARGRQILILAPEIGLTPQLVRRIESRLGTRAWTYHSALSQGERLACWRAAGNGRARVVVGTRSAVFLPLKNPGLVVVDEEHDHSFKQAEGARYHGRDVAVMRARMLGVPIVLGSATPSLESLHNADSGRYRLLEISRRAGAARQPHWRIVDARGRSGLLDPELERAMTRHLEAGGQVLLYRNRRGYAPVLMCSACGWQADCPRCSAHLTWHRHPGRLQCHHCGSQQPSPPRCPDCGEPELLTLGAGTERLEEMVAAAFDQVPVHRADRDRLGGRHDFERLLEGIRDGGACIVIGTQMLAKGHHLPGVTLAAVLDVDQALFSADFRAPERLAQTVSQVAGRAGRGDRHGEFLLLTRHPDHPLLAELGRGDYLALARRLLAERGQAELPPVSALALLRAESHQPGPARRFLEQAARRVQAEGIEITGPLPAIMSRRAGYWRFQLWLQADSRVRLAGHLGRCLPALHDLPGARRARWHLDIDPLEL